MAGSSRRLAYLAGVQRIVVKVGSRVLTDEGDLQDGVLDHLCAQIHAVRERGVEVALVSSGAIAAGRGKLGLSERPKTIPLRQASAAAGQAVLIGKYAQRFARWDREVAQVLLTADDLRNRRRFLNARHCLGTLFDMGIVPIINENDTVVVEELKFGDNDRLSALVTNLVRATVLVLLTDIDGFYDANPHENPEARRYDFIESVTEAHREQAGVTRSSVGVGGMLTKVEAARQAALSGASTIIAAGRGERVLERILDGEDIGTFFAAGEHIGTRKHWIAYSSEPMGDLVLDDGAVRALVRHKKSLLPSGVLRVQGDFEVGECVRCLDRAGREVARGLPSYRADDLRRIAGFQTHDIGRLLGYRYYDDEVIHRDDLVITEHHRPETEAAEASAAGPAGEEDGSSRTDA